MTQHMLTATRLSGGAVVYLGPGGWSGDIQAGLAVSDDQSEALAAGGQSGVDNNIVVAPYLIEIDGALGKRIPVRRRERIRAFGPTVVEQDAEPSPQNQDAIHVPV